MDLLKVLSFEIFLIIFFYIFHKSGTKTFLNWYINMCFKSTQLPDSLINYHVSQNSKIIDYNLCLHIEIFISIDDEMVLST